MRLKRPKKGLLNLGEEEAEIRQRNHQGEDLFDEWIHANEAMKEIAQDEVKKRG